MSAFNQRISRNRQRAVGIYQGAIITHTETGTPCRAGEIATYQLKLVHRP
jgi:hypothetical protein